MRAKECDEVSEFFLNFQVVLETEITNHGALALYQRLGFFKDKRLNKYYLNGTP